MDSKKSREKAHSEAMLEAETPSRNQANIAQHKF